MNERNAQLGDYYIRDLGLVTKGCLSIHAGFIFAALPSTKDNAAAHAPMDPRLAPSKAPSPTKIWILIREDNLRLSRVVDCKTNNGIV